MHPGNNVTADAEATFRLSGNIAQAWRGRNSADLRRLGAGDVHAVLACCVWSASV